MTSALRSVLLASGIALRRQPSGNKRRRSILSYFMGAWTAKAGGISISVALGVKHRSLLLPRTRGFGPLASARGGKTLALAAAPLAFTAILWLASAYSHINLRAATSSSFSSVRDQAARADGRAVECIREWPGCGLGFVACKSERLVQRGPIPRYFNEFAGAIGVSPDAIPIRLGSGMRRYERLLHEFNVKDSASHTAARPISSGGSAAFHVLKPNIPSEMDHREPARESDGSRGQGLLWLDKYPRSSASESRSISYYSLSEEATSR